jgi:hypothetical protein
MIGGHGEEISTKLLHAGCMFGLFFDFEDEEWHLLGCYTM